MKASYRLAGGSRRIVLGLLAGALLLIFTVSQATAQWRIIPELRVTGGYESDLVVDPEFTSTLVPGGPFTEVSPAVTVRRSLGSRCLVNLSTFATLQQFLNDKSRRLYAHTMLGDALWKFGCSMRGRMSVSFDYFDDSERETVRRLGMGGEAGLAFVRAWWNAELWVGGRGRRYPSVDVQDSHGQVSTYSEATWSGGTALRISLHERIVMKTDGILLRTNSRDPFFDSKSWTVSASADARLTSRLFVTISGTYQERQFTERTAGEDSDEYRQFGVGIRHVLAAGWDASLRWGYSTYTWPDGSDVDSHRLAIGLHFTWGRSHVPYLPRIDLQALAMEGKGAVQQQDSQGNVRFRIQAPSARAVSVVGSFNEWNVEATPLRSAGDGWWEAKLDLAPGTYEYAYIIDGQWRTPPEAPFTTEDGFGGINGILEVLPPDV